MSDTYVKTVNDLITEVTELKRAIKEQKDTIRKFQALTGVPYPAGVFARFNAPTGETFYTINTRSRERRRRELTVDNFRRF